MAKVKIENWTFNETDQKVLEKVSQFIPGRVFDIHAHVYSLPTLGQQGMPYTDERAPIHSPISEWRKHISWFVGEEYLKGGLFIPPPCETSAHINRTNDYVLDELGKNPGSAGLVLVSPDMGEEKLNSLLEHPQVYGIKPFFTYSGYDPVSDSPLSTYLTDWMWEAVEKKGGVILAHLTKHDALADPDNFLEIRKQCEKHPNTRLLLDHAARGFHAPNTIEGIKQLKGLNNVWFDTSCICEPNALVAIVRAFGPSRLMWGSDYPLPMIRGKAITIGDGFIWLSRENVNWNVNMDLGKPILLGIETLRAQRDAFEMLGLNKQDIENIFYNNAFRFLRKEET